MESCGCTVIGSEAEETVKVLPPMVNEVTTIEWLESEFLNVIDLQVVSPGAMVSKVTDCGIERLPYLDLP